MTHDQFLKGIDYFLAAYPNQRFGEDTLAAWWMALQSITEGEYQLAIAKLISESKAWFPSNNFAGAVNEIVRNTSPRFQQGYAKLPPPPKQLPPPREESKSLVEFHHHAMARFEAMRNGELPRNPGESVRDHCDRMQSKILSECRINGNPAPKQYAEAWR